jgi:hypothetical protein
MRVGGIGRGNAAGGRELRLSARGVRGEPAGQIDVFFIYLADAFSGAAEHFIGRAGICGLLELSDEENAGADGVAGNGYGIHQVDCAELRQGDRGAADRDCGDALVPADHGHRENFYGGFFSRGWDTHRCRPCTAIWVTTTCAIWAGK